MGAYIALAVTLFVAGGSAVLGASLELWPLVTLGFAVILLVALVAGAVAYRRLIRASRHAQRNSRFLLDEYQSERRWTGSTSAYTKYTGANLGALEWWAHSAGLNSARLVQRLTMLRSVDGRDLLAKMATQGQWTWNELSRALESHRLGGLARANVMAVFSNCDYARLAQLGDLCYRQNCLPQDIRDAATIYSVVHKSTGDTFFEGKKRSEFFIDSLRVAGLSSRAEKSIHLIDRENTNPNDGRLFRVNIMNPFIHSDVSEQSWLAEINQMYLAAGLMPLKLSSGTGPAFLRLEAEAAAPVFGGPLVTIAMPVFRPDEATDLAIRSALNQTYQNIEVIVVDDGSGPEYAERLKKWQEADRRVRVILSDQNSGAYTSRNIAYQRSKGEFLTVFDGDDWQHPQKIEKLLEASVAQDDARLVSARWARVDENLVFQYRGWKGAFITPAHVSVMFRTDTIRAQVGFWDAVRKAADTEFILRYQAIVNPEDPLEVSNVPLTLSLVGTNNLSIDDFRLGYRAPDRVAYRASYEHWHRAIGSGESDGFLDFPPENRKFPAPDKFLPSRVMTRELDLVLVGDFSATGKIDARLLEHVGEAQRSGHAVGLMHISSLLSTSSLAYSFSPEIMDAFANGTLTRVQASDSIHTDSVFVYDPTAFQFTSAVPSGIVSQSLIVFASELPFNSKSGRHPYEVSIVSENLYRLFQVRPTWLPMKKSVHQVISRVVAGGDIHDPNPRAFSELYPRQSGSAVPDLEPAHDASSAQMITAEQ